MNKLRTLPLVCALGLAFGTSHASAQIPIKKTIVSALIGMTTGAMGAGIIATLCCNSDTTLKNGIAGAVFLTLCIAQTALIDSNLWRIKESYESPRKEWEEADLGFHYITGIATFGTAVALLAYFFDGNTTKLIDR
jgi:hypothetical protein